MFWGPPSVTAGPSRRLKVAESRTDMTPRWQFQVGDKLSWLLCTARAGTYTPSAPGGQKLPHGQCVSALFFCSEHILPTLQVKPKPTAKSLQQEQTKIHPKPLITRKHPSSRWRSSRRAVTIRMCMRLGIHRLRFRPLIGFTVKRPGLFNLKVWHHGRCSEGSPYYGPFWGP